MMSCGATTFTEQSISDRWEANLYIKIPAESSINLGNDVVRIVIFKF